MSRIRFCEYPLCDTQIGGKRYCFEHQRLLDRFHAERETLFKALNDIAPLLASYWTASASEQDRIKMQAGRVR